MPKRIRAVFRAKGGPINIPIANEIIKPIEIKNSSKEIHGIVKDVNSDLAQVIELVN
ncbi:UNVERIFIED_CONTAM: hypothetical protein NCL1_62009 [Trichonephila clavipes]